MGLMVEDRGQRIGVKMALIVYRLSGSNLGFGRDSLVRELFRESGAPL